MGHVLPVAIAVLVPVDLKTVIVLLDVGRTGTMAEPVAVVKVSVVAEEDEVELPDPGEVGQSVRPHSRLVKQQPPPWLMGHAR